MPALCLSLVSTGASGAGSVGVDRLSCTYKGWWTQCVFKDSADVCINDPNVYDGKPPHRLTVDYKQRVIDLNGLKGRLYPIAEVRWQAAWDLALLGQPELVQEYKFNTTRVTLLRGGLHVWFACDEPHRDGRSRKQR